MDVLLRELCLIMAPVTEIRLLGRQTPIDVVCLLMGEFIGIYG